jgi:hypothetical protein
LNFLIYKENFVFFFINASYVVFAGWQVYIEPSLKGPKHEIFGFGVFMQSKPVWVGDSGTRPKKSKILWFGLENRKLA